MPHFKLAIFDLDGTLLNTYPGVRDGVLYLIDKYKLPMLTEEQLQSFVGPPVSVSLQKHYGIDEATSVEMLKDFREYYAKESLLHADEYEGLKQTLKDLQNEGVQTTVATYKRDDMAKNILGHFELDKNLDSIFGSDAEGKLSKSDIIRLAIEDAGISDYSEAVMIGDTDNDAKGAAELGVPFIGVTYGFGFKTKEDVMRFSNVGVANSPKELMELI